MPLPCASFNPFTETPQLGVNYQFDPDFGKATDKTMYQNPRTFLFSAGVKF